MMQSGIGVSAETGALMAASLAWLLRLEYKLGRIEANIEHLTRRVTDFTRLLERRHGGED